MNGMISKTNLRLKSQMTAKGFELETAAELLFRELVCTTTTVDAGVDLMVLNRNGKSINLQVKGRNFSGHGTGVETVQISAKSYDDPASRADFFVIGIRYTTGDPSSSAYGSFLILSRHELEGLRRRGYVKSVNDKLRFHLNVNFDEETGSPEHIEVQSSYGKRRRGIDISETLNAWHKIERS